MANVYTQLMTGTKPLYKYMGCEIPLYLSLNVSFILRLKCKKSVKKETFVNVVEIVFQSPYQTPTLEHCLCLYLQKSLCAR